MNLDRLYESFKLISRQVLYGDIKYLNSEINQKNSSEDSIKKIDMIAHNYIIDSVKNIDNIIGCISEESDDIVLFREPKNDNNYILAFDPIDGSKNLLSNITVGTIYVLYKYNHIENTIEDIVEAGYCLYGPRTILVRTKDDKVEHLSLNESNNFVKDCNLSLENNKSKIYCINQSNTYSNEIDNLIHYFKKNNFNQRWVGSMVADCHQILCKGGIFMYPGNVKNPNGKLRLLYEVLPFAFIFQKAGGIGLDSYYKDIIGVYKNYELDELHKKVPIILCSLKEYDEMITHLLLQCL